MEIRISLCGTRILIVIVDAGLEHALAHAAKRAAPVIGNILKCCARCDSVIGITFLRIVSISAGITKIFLHNEILLSKNNF